MAAVASKLSEVRQWHDFLQQACFIHRLSSSEFTSRVNSFQAHHAHLPSKALVEPLLDQAPYDPRVPGYLKELLKSSLLKVSDILNGLRSKQATKSDGPAQEMPTQTLMFQMLADEVGQEVPSREIQLIIHHMLFWIETFPSSLSIAFFAAKVLSHPHCGTIFKKPIAGPLRTAVAERPNTSDQIETFRQRLETALAVMIAHTNSQNMQLASNLLYWQNELGLISGQDSAESNHEIRDMAAMAFERNVPDLPMNTRAGLFVYLNALVSFVSLPYASSPWNLCLSSSDQLVSRILVVS